ncbi:MAG: hypothetical protein QM718_05750 [Steroidobacteraceae bacterium]
MKAARDWSHELGRLDRERWARNRFDRDYPSSVRLDLVRTTVCDLFAGVAAELSCEQLPAVQAFAHLILIREACGLQGFGNA